MKIIFKIFLLKKNIIRHFIIILLLISILFLSFEAKETINKQIHDKLNITDNKIATIVLKDNISINDIKNISYVNKVYKENNEYIVIFNDYTNVEEFKDEYKDYYNSIKINSINELDTKLLKSISSLISVVIIITIISITTLLILNLFEILFEEKNELVLLKIMGYKNKTIFTLFLKVLIISVTTIYLLSIVLSKIISIIVSIFINKLITIHIIYYLIIYISLILITIIINIICNIYIRKISLLRIKNSNIY